MHSLDLILVLVSALLHAGWSVAIKGSRDPLAFNLVQSVAAAGIALALLPAVEIGEIPRGFWPILAGTGVAHGLYLYWLSRAFTVADISLVYPIARSTPALMPFIAAPVLGESISLGGGVGIATVVAGMWLMNLQGELHGRAFLQRGMGFAYLTLLSTVAYGLLDKSAMLHLDDATWTSVVPRPILYFFLLYLACSLLYVPLALRHVAARALPDFVRSEWRAAFLALVVGFASYGLILQALRTAPASYVVAVRQSSVFFVLALSVLRLGEEPTRSRLLGAVLTVAGVVLIALAP